MKIFSTNNQINWDAVSGIGAVPNNRDVDYFGFVKQMTPSEFLSLVPPDSSNPETIPFIEQALDEGKGIGQPFLVVEWNKDKNIWQVIDHEGRSRTKAIRNKYGEVLIPVHIFPIGLRARNISEEMRLAPFIKQP